MKRSERMRRLEQSRKDRGLDVARDRDEARAYIEGYVDGHAAGVEGTTLGDAELRALAERAWRAIERARS